MAAAAPVAIASRSSLDGGHQLLEGVDELLDALGQQLRRDVVEVDPGFGQRAQVGLGSMRTVAAPDRRARGRRRRAASPSASC
jgi:hypothetical protein